MAQEPSLGYDDAVFRQGLRRRARRGRVTVRDILDSFWEAGPELRDSLLQHGGQAMFDDAERKLCADVVGRLEWQVRAMGFKLTREAVSEL